MKKNKNIPLNLKEQINSRIGLICSIVVMILLVFVHSINLIIRSYPEAGRSGCQRSRAEESWKQQKAAKAPEISTATVIAVGDNLYHGQSDPVR